MAPPTQSPLKVVVFTLDESSYLPAALEILAAKLGPRIACIVAFAPARRGGRIASLAWRAGFLGARGTVVLGLRMLRRRLPFRRERNLRSVAIVGARHGIPTVRAAQITEDFVIEALDRHPADLLVSLSCPRIIGPAIRARFRAGAVNVHSAPLPRYRGHMPSFWILARGEPRTAVTVHEIVDRVDAGDILLQREIAIDKNETWDSLLRKTKAAAALAALDAIEGIAAGTLTRAPNRDAESSTFPFPSVRDAQDFRARGGRIA